MNFLQLAIEKIERSEKPKDNKAGIVFPHVKDILKNFCSQDDEFAQAVAQHDGSVAQCCEAVMKGVGSAVSDIDVYRRAVQYYFAGADIAVNMTINLCASVEQAAAEPEKAKSSIVINLLDFL